MRFDSYSFGAITIDGVTYDHDVVLDHGSVSTRRQKPSKPFRDRYVEGRIKEGLSKKEIIRCLKRYVAREVYHRLDGVDDTIGASPRGGREASALTHT